MKTTENIESRMTAKNSDSRFSTTTTEFSTKKNPRQKRNENELHACLFHKWIGIQLNSNNNHNYMNLND